MVEALGLRAPTPTAWEAARLSSLHLLGRVVAALFAAHPGGLHALAVDDASAGLWVSAEAYPRPPEQCLVQPLPSAVDTPEAEIVIDSLHANGKKVGKDCSVKWE